MNKPELIIVFFALLALGVVVQLMNELVGL
jgi:hypothetical protein